jgi:hypothetical protein
MPTNSGPVAYDPSNALQQEFLSALALGESGENPSLFEGFGSTPSNLIDLSGNATDQYGFPIWSGGEGGATHAAGIFQFEPGTWDQIASEFGLNFGSLQGQEAGAWYEAQQTDPNLYAQLQAGQFSSIQSALTSVWPSAAGSPSNPGGLASSLASGAGANLSGSNAAPNGPGASAAAPGTGAASAAAAGGNASLGFLGGIQDVEQFFLRGGILVIGAVVIIVALWQLLSDHTPIPSPGDTARSVAKGATALVAA